MLGEIKLTAKVSIDLNPIRKARKNYVTQLELRMKCNQQKERLPIARKGKIAGLEVLIYLLRINYRNLLISLTTYFINSVPCFLVLVVLNQFNSNPFISRFYVNGINGLGDLKKESKV